MTDRSSAEQTTGNRSGGESPFAPRQGANGIGAGEGKDRRIKRSMFTPKRLIVGAAILVLVGLLGYGVWSVSAGGQRLTVDRSRLTVSTVHGGPFQELIAITGTVLPIQTVYLEATKGGRVEEVFARSGEMVARDEPILRLSNPDLQLQLMQNEAQLAEQVSRLQTMRFQIAQNRLNLRQQMAEMDYRIRTLQRQFDREEQLHEKGYIAERDFQETSDELQYWRERQELTQRSFRQDSLAQAGRVDQMTAAVQQMRIQFGALQQSLANLTVRAPISGQLTSLDAEVGEIRSAGARFGQIDVLDSLKVQAQIDEFYIARVQVGQTAMTEDIRGEQYAMQITRIYPEVTSGRFRVDLIFTDAVPPDLRRGQSVRLRLELSAPEEAVLLERGGFYQSTGGNWAYVLTGEGTAVRQQIQLGRQNPEYFEVLSGLDRGDQVVTSSYGTFGDADVLVLN